MKIINIQSKLQLITGLHIGSSDDSMKIGGVDSPVITREVLSDDEGSISFHAKHKVVEPYIAGSSLKGKLRSLLEHYFRLIDPTQEGNVVDSNSNFGDVKKRELIIKLFGESAENKSEGLQITRALFRDCFITNDVRKAYIQNKIELFEEKAENVIDRNTGTTKNGGLRHIQRVPSALEFNFDISIRIFDSDNQELLENTIKLGLKLLELDALGGSGSRGYGKVAFHNIKETIEDLAKKVV